MAPRLKVFNWSDGFHAFTVATSSRDKALAAWGVEGDLFKTGLAKEVLPGEAGYDAALETPGEVVRSGLKLDAAKLPPAPKASKDTARRDKLRADIRQAEADLKDVEARFGKDRDALDRKRRALDAEASALDDREAKARAPVEKRLAALKARL